MASLTNNLNLVKYDVSDKITPSGFNGNFDTIDTEISALKKDYIVDYGTQDFWTYRKWASGIAECWGETKSTDYSVTDAWSGWCYGTLSRRDYPISFVGTPIETMSHNLVGASTGNPYSSVVGCVKPATATQTGQYEVYRPSSLQGVVSHMKYRVIGKWK